MKGLYVHIPFCASICHYCDFMRSIYREDIADAYITQLEKQFAKKDMVEVDSVYIGGGTPSALNEAQLRRLLKLLKPYSEHAKEVTIESNVESLSDAKLEIMKEYHVNRISLGVQSLDANLLAYMNRKHTKAMVLDVLNRIHKVGITNISVDIMYGFQNQSIHTIEETLNTIIDSHKVSHISYYSLTIESKSVFSKMGVELVDNEIEASMYERGIEILEKNGFKQYEVANFAKDNLQSLHNLHYWKYDDFYGIGLGASGKEDRVRYTIQGSIIDYNQEKELVEKSVLSLQDCMFEQIMMETRLVSGLDIHRFNARYDVDFEVLYKQEIALCVDKNWAEVVDGFFRVKCLIQLHDVLLLFIGE